MQRHTMLTYKVYYKDIAGYLQAVHVGKKSARLRVQQARCSAYQVQLAPGKTTPGILYAQDALLASLCQRYIGRARITRRKFTARTCCSPRLRGLTVALAPSAVSSGLASEELQAHLKSDCQGIHRSPSHLHCNVFEVLCSAPRRPTHLHNAIFARCALRATSLESGAAASTAANG